MPPRRISSLTRRVSGTGGALVLDGYRIDEYGALYATTSIFSGLLGLKGQSTKAEIYGGAYFSVSSRSGFLRKSPGFLTDVAESAVA